MEDQDYTDDLLSQKAMILDYLKKGKKITGKVARKLFGCFTLAQRIYDLRQKGEVIADRKVHRYDKSGKYQGVHSEYWMPEFFNK